jgi:1-acyl-sn-glycerol-3-phosphate acyltransferase
LSCIKKIAFVTGGQIAIIPPPPTSPQSEPWQVTYQIVKRLFNPLILGAENIPRRPCLFVGNHSLAALDGWVLAPVFIKELNRFVRGLGDKFLFSSPAMGDKILKTGGVMGHPEVCSAMMKAEQDLMVFPGGAQEAVKPASELYELKWKERYGFVKLAAKHGYTIMPMGIVGPDEFYGHLIEGQDIPDSMLGTVLRRLGLLTDDFREDIMPPVPVGALGTLLPKPQRVYLGFGDPIDLSQYTGRTPSKAQQKAIRAEVADQIETQLAELLFTRAQNRGKDGLLRKLLTL